MKKISMLLLTSLIIMANLANAQEINQSEVPSLVLNSFQQTYSKAINVEWELNGNEYKVEFEIGDKDHSTWFDETGKIKASKKELMANELPAIVRNTIKKEFNGCRIKEAEMQVKGNSETYKVEVASLTKEWKVTLNKEGEVLERILD